MGFKIFASGRSGFHYDRPDCVDGDDFDMLKLMNKIQFTEPSKMGALGLAVDVGAPSADITDLATKIGKIEFMHNIRNGVDMLATCGGAEAGWIAVSGRNAHLLWVDTARFEKFSFSGHAEPGIAFLNAIRKVLEETDLCTIGVMFQIGIAVNLYQTHIGSGGTPQLSIQLFH